MKRPYKILLILTGALALTVVVIAANVSRSRSQVRGVEADIRYGSTPRLVEGQTVVDSVLAACPQLPTMLVREVDRDEVAAAAEHVSYLKEVSVAVSVSGRVVVKAVQRRPVARLFYGGREYYFDSEGAVMPASKVGECNVLVAGGDFTEPLRVDSLNSQMLSLVKVANYLDKEKKYGRLIDQIYVERDGDVMMAPKIGDHVIELGDAENLDEKFSNLLAFYQKGMPRAGWNTYGRISLKFRGQVVCTKEKR